MNGFLVNEMTTSEWDLIDRAELLKDYTQTFVVGHGVKIAETFQGVVKQAQKVDAVPMSVIEEIKAEIAESSCGSWYIQNPDKTVEKEILVRMVDVLGIIERKEKEYKS